MFIIFKFCVYVNDFALADLSIMFFLAFYVPGKYNKIKLRLYMFQGVDNNE